MGSFDKPLTFVIVPGAWHTQLHVQPTLDSLQKRGYDARCTVLRSVQIDKPRPTWDEEVSNISDTVLDLLDKGHEICLILHSYAGIPGNEALNRIVQAGGLERKGPTKGRLQSVIFFLAIHMPTGVVVDVAQMEGPQNPLFHLNKEKNISYHDDPYSAFYNDIPTREEAQPYIDESRPTHYIPGGGATLTEDWKRIPRAILASPRDQALPPEQMLQLWNDHKDEIEWIDESHTPFMVKPDYCADLLVRLANKATSQ